MISVEKWPTPLLSYWSDFFSRLIRNPLVIHAAAGTIVNSPVSQIPSFSPAPYSHLYSAPWEVILVCQIWIQHQYSTGVGIFTSPQPCLRCFCVVTKSYLNVRSSELLPFMDLTLHQRNHYGWIVDLFGAENRPVSSLVKTDSIIGSNLLFNPSASLVPWMNSHWWMRIDYFQSID